MVVVSIKAKLPFKEKTAFAEVIKQGDIIVAGINNSPFLVNPPQAFIDAQATLGEIKSLTLVAAKGNREAKAQRQYKRRVLYGQMARVRDWVTGEAKGDIAVILSAGMKATKEREPVDSLTPPGNLRLRYGPVPGSIRALWDGVKHRDIYKVAISQDTQNWTTAQETAKVYTNITDLNPGELYYVRIGAVGKNGVVYWSDIAEHRAA